LAPTLGPALGAGWHLLSRSLVRIPRRERPADNGHGIGQMPLAPLRWRVAPITLLVRVASDLDWLLAPEGLR